MLALIRTNPSLLPPLAMVALLMLGNGMIIPILSLYALTFGVTSTLVASLITMFGLGRLATNLPAGALSQRIGRRPVACIGSAIVMAAALGAALSDTFYELLFWRLIQGAGSGIYLTVTLAALADSSSPEDRSSVMALFQATILVGIGIGPAIGGWLAQHFGFTAPFWMYAGGAFLATCVGLAVFRDTPRKEQSQEFGSRPQSARALVTPAFAAVCMMSFGTFFTRTAVEQYLVPIIGKEVLGLELGSIGLALTLSTFATLFTLSWARTTIDRWGSRIATLVAVILIIFCIGLIAIADRPSLFYAGVILLGVVSGLSNTSVAMYGIEIAPRSLYGTAIGIQRSVADCGFVSGPLIVGLSRDWAGVSLVGGLGINMALMALLGIVFWFMTPVQPRPARR